MNKANLSRSLTFLLVVFLALLGVVAVLSTSGANPSLAQTIPTRTPTPSNYLPVILNEYPAAFLPQIGTPRYEALEGEGEACNRSGMAGVVYDMSGQPVAGGRYSVHVWGAGLDDRVPVGSAREIGAAGWEVTLSDTLSAAEYYVQLELAVGTAVSSVFAVRSRADCERNLIRLDFAQARDVQR